MKICRFRINAGEPRVGLVAEDGAIVDLSAGGIKSITEILEDPAGTAHVGTLLEQKLPRLAQAKVQLLPPVERQEIWAAGVTYLRSKHARMDESDFSASAYDRVYTAARPELFFKALPEKAVGSGQAVGIRADAAWNVPEPELALVINSRKELVGFTIGNDMSSRDIEGENLLYLPQAKVYDRSCSLGPWIVLGASEAEARGWTVGLEIVRDGQAVFQGQTQVSNLKRGFDELVGYLGRSQIFPHGAILLTGTGLVPGDDFSLRAADTVRICISSIGTLENPVVVV